MGEPATGELAVVIDPGRAFGTGAHPTTRLCIELLATSARGSLLDVGCGSGVLAIAAARLGFSPIAAIDDDPIAIETTLANAAVNGVGLHAPASTPCRELPRRMSPWRTYCSHRFGRSSRASMTRPSPPAI